MVDALMRLQMMGVISTALCLYVLVELTTFRYSVLIRNPIYMASEHAAFCV